MPQQQQSSSKLLWGLLPRRRRGILFPFLFDNMDRSKKLSVRHSFIRLVRLTREKNYLGPLGFHTVQLFTNHSPNTYPCSTAWIARFAPLAKVLRILVKLISGPWTLFFERVQLHQVWTLLGNVPLSSLITRPKALSLDAHILEYTCFVKLPQRIANWLSLGFYNC